MHNHAVLYGRRHQRSARLSQRRPIGSGWPPIVTSTDSQYNLGILYARGIGVELNLAESYKWLVLAANQGDKDAAKKRDEFEVKLDQQSLAAVRLAVQTWAPQAAR